MHFQKPMDGREEAERTQRLATPIGSEESSEEEETGLSWDHRWDHLVFLSPNTLQSEAEKAATAAETAAWRRTAPAAQRTVARTNPASMATRSPPHPGIDREEQAAFAGALADALAEAMARNPPAGGQGQVAEKTRKVDKLSDNSATAWLIWKEGFEMIRKTANWTGLRARRELFIAMEGDAASATRGIAVEDPPADAQGPGYVPLTLEAVLRTYESRFCTAAASDMARAEFLALKQKEGESIVNYHARGRSLWERAAPPGHRLREDDPIEGRELRERFTHGLTSRDIKKSVLEKKCGTYSELLVAATDAEAIMKTLEKDDVDRRRNRSGINKMSPGGRDYSNLRCWTCDRMGHISPHCPQKGNDRGSVDKIEKRGDKGRGPLKKEGGAGAGKKKKSTTGPPGRNQKGGAKRSVHLLAGMVDDEDAAAAAIRETDDEEEN